MKLTPQPSERYLRFIGRLDRLTVVLVLLFAFLLGTFPARNADVWMHLATGQRITHFDYSFGTDPFNFTTGGRYWPNHAWLWDVLLYSVSAIGGPENLGGILATLLKGVMVVVLAGLMLSIRRPHQSLWAPACVTVLALITLSPALELRPALVSLIFLVLTLRILVRDGKPASTAGDTLWVRLHSASPQRLYALPILFVFWVNLDDWFWLGPLLVGLYIAGEWLQEQWAPVFSETSNREERRTLWKVLLLGLLACLISPHHVRGLTVPRELFAASRFPELKGDPLFQSYFVGPFDGAYFTPLLGMNIAGLSYFLLLGATIGTFVLNRAGWRWWRLVVFGFFLLLSLLHMQLIPFFAAVAGPISALNIHDFIELEAGRKLAADVRWRRTAIAARGIALQTLLVLLILAAAGWLHPPQAGRRLGFGIIADPSLKDAAGRIDAWRTAGCLPAGNVVNVHPDLAAYFAWFAPSTKGFFDWRIELMDRSRAGYARLRNVNEMSRSGGSLEAIWPGIQRTWNANQLVLYGIEVAQSAGLFYQLLQDQSHWTLLWLDGRVSWFGGHDPAWAALRFDPNQLAFGPKASRAPLHGAEQLPQINYLSYFLFGTPAMSRDTDLAKTWVVYFKDAGRSERAARLRQSAMLIGIAPAPLAASFGHVLMADFPQQLDLGPPAAPLLAIRAARQAIADNPNDGLVYIYLNLAYDLLGHDLEDRWAGVSNDKPLPPTQLLRSLNQLSGTLPLSAWVDRKIDHRRLLRQVQRLAMLRAHLMIDADSDYTHRTLHDLLWNMNYYDVALEHLRSEVGILRRQGSRNLEVQESVLEQREREVEALRRHAQSAKARSAQSWFQPYGLAGEAMTRVRQGQGSAEDQELYLYLLLTTGQIEELDTALHGTPALRQLLGARFHWYEGMVAAARGNYQQADQKLQESIQSLLPPLHATVGELLQSRTIHGTMPPLGQLAMAWSLQQQTMGSSGVVSRVVREAAELQLLRGLLALEVGDISAATGSFRLCLHAAGPDGPTSRVARRYLELIDDAAGSARKHLSAGLVPHPR